MSSSSSCACDLSFHVRLGSERRGVVFPSSSFSASDLQAFQSLLELISKTFGLLQNSFRLSYFDEEHEKISVTCWNDFKVAVDEHAAMNKTLQIYVENGDEQEADAEEEDLVFINNSPNVPSNQSESNNQPQSDDPNVSHCLSQTESDNHPQSPIVALDEKANESGNENVGVNPAAAANTSFWWRLFGSGNGSVNDLKCVSVEQEEAKGSAPSTMQNAASSPVPAVSVCASPAPVVEICPTLSMLMLSDLSDLLNHFRAQTVEQLDDAGVEKLPANLHTKVQFQRTKQVFEEELSAALAEMQKRANALTAANLVNTLQATQPKKEQVDALVAIEDEEKKEFAAGTAAASYSSIVAGSVSSCSSNASSAISSSASSSAAATSASASVVPESKSSNWSGPVGFSMSDESVAEVVDMCRRMGFKADVDKIKYLMEKSQGNLDTLIDWMITDTVVKITVPK